MNDRLDKLLQDVLSTSGDYDPAKAENLSKEVADMYDRKLKRWRYVVWALLLIDTVVLVGAIAAFLDGSDVKVLIGSAVLALLAFELSVLMKLWYWQIDTKFSVLREVTQLKLQVAQLMETETNHG